MLHLLRQRQCAHEVGEIVGESLKRKPDGVVAELAARQPRSFDRILAFLDVLLRFTPLIVERHHSLGWPGQVGDDEADAGKAEQYIKEGKNAIK